ncbi:MAG: hypothetical protein AAFX99_34695, partial [Myxococcota bacterium]
MAHLCSRLSEPLTPSPRLAQQAQHDDILDNNTMQHFNTHSFLSGRSQLLVGLVLGIATTLALSAMADGDPTTDDVPRTLPYQGRLELNGEPINATGDDALHIMFELYDGPTANVPTYRQSLVVEVYAGRFTATIGPSGLDANDAEVFIDDIIANADDLQ